MHFFKLTEDLHRPFTTYLMALALLCLAYLLGNLPLVVLFNSLDASSTSSGDIIQSIQLEFGRTVTLLVLLAPWAFLCVSFSPITKYILKWPILYLFTTRQKFNWKRFFVGFSIWFGMSSILFIVQFNATILWQFNWSTFLPLFFCSAFILVLQCTAEELVFRSFLFKWMSQTQISVIVQILLSGFIFGYLHSSNPEVEALGKIALIYYISTGVFLGLVAFLDRGIELTMGFHFANNFFAAIIVTSSWQVFQTDALFIDTSIPQFGLIEILTSFGTQAIFFLICWKVYKWNLSSMRSRLS